MTGRMLSVNDKNVQKEDKVLDIIVKIAVKFHEIIADGICIVLIIRVAYLDG